MSYEHSICGLWVNCNVLIIKLQMYMRNVMYKQLPMLYILKAIISFFNASKVRFKKRIFRVLGSTIFYCHKNYFGFDFAAPLKIYLKVNQKVVYRTINFNLITNLKYLSHKDIFQRLLMYFRM